MIQTRDLVRRISFLREVDSPVLERIAARLPERRFPKGTMIFHEGEPCPGFWLVKQGSVNVIKISSRGRVQILETAYPGDCFALVSAVDGGPYPASAEVREDAVLAFFPREELLAAMNSAPAAAVAVARTCAARLRRLTCLASSVCLEDVRQRVAGYLASEADARGMRRRDGGIDVVLQGPQHEIARRLGMAREVYARTLAALERQGLIEHERDLVRVHDLEALRRAAS